jgi:hypothetical protein
MATSSCPLPEVEEALKPYIRSRQETQRIRQAIAGYIQEQLGPEHGPVTPISLASAYALPNDIDASSGKAIGIYRQYFQALAAHRRAQLEYESVKADLEHLRADADERKANAVHEPTDGARSYVKYLKQRKQNERLIIVRAALTKLVEDEETSTQVDVKQAVKDQLGPPPDAPTSAIETDLDTKIDEMVFNLKKELVVAKSKLEETNAAKEHGEASTAGLNVSPEVETLALLKVRDGLISWMETELSKVAPEGDASELGDDSQEAGADDLDVNGQTAVHALYDQYISSREALVESLEALSKEYQPPEAPSHQRTSSTQSSIKFSGTDPKPLTSTELLSYLPHLLQSSRDEGALLQQTSHLRRQLNLSSSEVKNSIQRLAGESQMVAPDTTDMGAWRKAAAESTASTSSFIEEQIDEGEKSVRHTREVLVAMQAKKTALGRVKGTM